MPDGWFIYNVHGLDGEGWGPMRSAYLLQVLEKLIVQPDSQHSPSARSSGLR